MSWEILHNDLNSINLNNDQYQIPCWNNNFLGVSESIVSGLGCLAVWRVVMLKVECRRSFLGLSAWVGPAAGEATGEMLRWSLNMLTTSDIRAHNMTLNWPDWTPKSRRQCVCNGLLIWCFSLAPHSLAGYVGWVKDAAIGRGCWWWDISSSSRLQLSSMMLHVTKQWFRYQNGSQSMF